MDWARLAPAGVHVHIVPGDHDTVLMEPQVRRLGKVLAAELADVAAQRQPATMNTCV